MREKQEDGFLQRQMICCIICRLNWDWETVPCGVGGDVEAIDLELVVGRWECGIGNAFGELLVLLFKVVVET